MLFATLLGAIAGPPVPRPVRRPAPLLTPRGRLLPAVAAPLLVPAVPALLVIPAALEPPAGGAPLVRAAPSDRCFGRGPPSCQSLVMSTFTNERESWGGRRDAMERAS